MIFLQDQKKRLTLQTQQSNGGASLEQGRKVLVWVRQQNKAKIYCFRVSGVFRTLANIYDGAFLRK